MLRLKCEQTLYSLLSCKHLVEVESQLADELGSWRYVEGVAALKNVDAFRIAMGSNCHHLGLRFAACAQHSQLSQDLLACTARAALPAELQEGPFDTAAAFFTNSSYYVI